MPNARLIQCHFWLSKEDYTFLQVRAQERDEPVSALLRRVVRRLRQTEQAARSEAQMTMEESSVASRDTRIPHYSTRTSR
jgi:hypothetical protein